jgi:mRNA-degrading endonuclease RelE of RelBE toxin-antitoxin system
MKIEIERATCEFVKELPLKTRRIIVSHLRKLEDPLNIPGIEKLGSNVYRLHVGRIYTILLCIIPEQKLVRATDILPIELAHKRYRQFNTGKGML